ncbi:hypothetical protein H9Q70_002802 [Fusarium xylarioides]|nr:hypothetical protein H9Q70_002802 [Fusarium xylarioides]KAG5783873.1 hypothetical protein H9Q73_002439 [Fusarium xylarioides]
MADPEPGAAPATVVEVAEEDDVVIISDDPMNSLTVEDLPMGVLKDDNKQAAIRIIEMFKEKAPSMPRQVRDEILDLLKKGAFHHNTSSRTEPSHHPLAEKMWDRQVKGPWWYHITYENWFVLVGIYGLEKLERSAVGPGIRSSIERRYGGDIGIDLTWRNHPVDQGQHARHLLTQLAAKFGEHHRTADQLQKTVNKLQKIAQKLLEQRQRGLTSHDQRASQIAEDDDPMKNWADDYEDDDEWEKLAGYYYFGNEGEDDDERENFFTRE